MIDPGPNFYWPIAAWRTSSRYLLCKPWCTLVLIRTAWPMGRLHRRRHVTRAGGRGALRLGSWARIDNCSPSSRIRPFTARHRFTSCFPRVYEGCVGSRVCAAQPRGKSGFSFTRQRRMRFSRSGHAKPSQCTSARRTIALEYSPAKTCQPSPVPALRPPPRRALAENHPHARLSPSSLTLLFTDSLWDPSLITVLSADVEY